MAIELNTHRLTLREFVLDDAPFIVELLNQPSFLQFIGDKNVRTRDDAEAYMKSGPIDSYHRNGFGLYLVELKENRNPIGMCGLLKRDSLSNADLGFAFLPEYWGKGYASEAAAAVLAHAREHLRLSNLLAITNPDNDASIRVLERLGFQFAGMIKLPDDVKLFRLTL